jgi:hypothetical protein
MRGQVSLDFILTIVVALVVLGSIAAVGSTIIEAQKSSTIRQQLDSIGNTLAALISTSAVLDDADSASISYTIPKIAVPGEERLQPCKIEIIGDVIKLSYEAEPTVSVEKKFVDPRGGATGIGSTPALTAAEPGACGSLITISKS